MRGFLRFLLVTFVVSLLIAFGLFLQTKALNNANSKASIEQAFGVFAGPNYERFKNLAEGFQAFVTSLAIIIGAIWAYFRFRLFREGMPLIQIDLDIVLVHRQNGRWLVDLVAFLENKGKARLEIEKCDFELRYSLPGDTVDANTVLVPDMFVIKNGLNFPIHLELKEPWLRDDESIILNPGVRMRHSLLTSLPEDATTALFAIEFEYPKGEKESEMDARLIAIPRDFQGERRIND
jgi:hypothetical protein